MSGLSSFFRNMIYVYPGIGPPSQVAEHDVQADQAAPGVVEGLRDRSDDPEPERLPQVHGRRVGLDDRVELDAREALPAAPVQYVLPERAAYALALAGRIDKEGRRRDVRSAAGPVRPHLRGARDDPVALGHDRLAGRLLHPPGPRLVKRL